jgi:hypothetical protein
MTDFIPQNGDHVTVKGQTGVYVVYLVDTSIRVAEVMERRSGLRLSTIPWDSLTSLAEEEAQRKPGNVDRVILLDPSQFLGVLLHTMAIFGLSRVRTESFHLFVVPFLAHHPVQLNG